MSRTFWFLAGAAASAYVAIKGREYYRKLTPEGVREQIEATAAETTEKTKHWVADFAETYANARAAKHSELMGLLTQTERRELN